MFVSFFLQHLTLARSYQSRKHWIHLQQVSLDIDSSAHQWSGTVVNLSSPVISAPKSIFMILAQSKSIWIGSQLNWVPSVIIKTEWIIFISLVCSAKMRMAPDSHRWMSCLCLVSIRILRFEYATLTGWLFSDEYPTITWVKEFPSNGMLLLHCKASNYLNNTVFAFIADLSMFHSYELQLMQLSRTILFWIQMSPISANSRWTKSWRTSRLSWESNFQTHPSKSDNRNWTNINFT